MQTDFTGNKKNTIEGGTNPMKKTKKSGSKVAVPAPCGKRSGYNPTEKK